jgi:hypothetical protein
MSEMKGLWALAAACVLAGCGHPAAPQVENLYGEAPAFMAPTVGLPTTIGIPQIAALPTLDRLTAVVSKKKNGTFLGAGAFRCTVEVNNANSRPLSGTLKVTFLNGKKPSRTAPITTPVSLGPNETRSFDFEDKKWGANDVTVDVTTQGS